MKSKLLLGLFLSLIVGAVVLKQQIVKTKLELTGADLSADGLFHSEEKTAWFMNKQVAALQYELPIPKFLAQNGASSQILGDTTGGKWIDVDLSTQTVRAMEADRAVYEFKVSTGKWFPTPTGDFTIWSKYKYIKMSGGSKELNTYYYLPNVPYTMFFNQGFALHGAYWHNNFGYPMSHGCVNIAIPDAEKLFYWADPVLPEGKGSVTATKGNPGTRVIVHGVAPKT